MKGLDSNGAAWHAEAATAILTDRAPAYIQSLFEQRLHGHGMGLSDLAIFAAAMSDLVHMEAFKDLHKVYSALNLPTVGAVTRKWSDLAAKGYMLGYIIGNNITAKTIDELNYFESELTKFYSDWETTYMWVKDFRKTHDLQLQSVRNPFLRHRDSFDSEVRFVQELGHHFGSFQDLSCKSIKSRLVELEHQGSGRVRLSSFYAGGVSGDWTLSESVEYLRNLGALDETDPKKPTVVIPNYITSHTNCGTSAGFYTVCCVDECEGLLRHLEIDLASPSAEPKGIADLVSTLPSDTVDAPRNLSVALLGRLDEIATHHGGQVPLHGRLFAQWMHHAYPRECPFPHVTGTTSPMTPDDFMAHHGIEDVEATMEDMRWHYSQKEHEDLDEEISLPWTQEEELVSGELLSLQPKGNWMRGVLRVAMAFLLLASSVVGLMRAGRVAFASDANLRKHEQVLV